MLFEVVSVSDNQNSERGLSVGVDAKWVRGIAVAGWAGQETIAVAVCRPRTAASQQRPRGAVGGRGHAHAYSVGTFWQKVSCSNKQVRLEPEESASVTYQAIVFLTSCRSYM